MHKFISPHGDFDHMGDTINLVNNFKVEKVIFNCGEFNDLIKVLNKKKTNHLQLKSNSFMSNLIFF